MTFFCILICWGLKQRCHCPSLISFSKIIMHDGSKLNHDYLYFQLLRLLPSCFLSDWTFSGADQCLHPKVNSRLRLLGLNSSETHDEFISDNISMLLDCISCTKLIHIEGDISQLLYLNLCWIEEIIRSWYLKRVHFLIGGMITW